MGGAPVHSDPPEELQEATPCSLARRSVKAAEPKTPGEPTSPPPRAERRQDVQHEILTQDLALHNENVLESDRGGAQLCEHTEPARLYALTWCSLWCVNYISTVMSPLFNDDAVLAVGSETSPAPDLSHPSPSTFSLVAAVKQHIRDFPHVSCSRRFLRGSVTSVGAGTVV